MSGSRGVAALLALAAIGAAVLGCTSDGGDAETATAGTTAVASPPSAERTAVPTEPAAPTGTATDPTGTPEATAVAIDGGSADGFWTGSLRDDVGFVSLSIEDQSLQAFTLSFDILGCPETAASVVLAPDEQALIDRGSFALEQPIERENLVLWIEGEGGPLTGEWNGVLDITCGDLQTVSYRWFADDPEPLPATMPEPFVLGAWAGATGQGMFVNLFVDDGAVSSSVVGFRIDGCAVSEVILDYEGVPDAPIVLDGTFSLAEPNAAGGVELTMEGTYTAAGEWTGTLEVSCDGSPPVQTTWFAGGHRAGRTEPEILQAGLVSELIERLPEASIPDGFWIAGAGDRNFDPWTSVVARGDEWLLATYSNSVYPVPSGWTTINTHNEENLLVFSRGGIEVSGDSIDGYSFDPEPEVLVRIGVGWETGVSAVYSLIADARDSFVDDPGTDLLATETYGADSGYLLARVNAAEGAQHALLFYTRMTNYEGDQGFTAIVALWDSDAAAEYYGIIREIVGNWADLENNLIGAELPAELPQ